MKKSSLKRSISMLLVVALVVTSFPTYVFGYANTDANQPVAGSEDSVIKYDPNYKGTIQIEDELSTKRGEFEKHFVQSDGSMIAVSYAQKVHYEEDGTWKDIDSRLELKDKEKGLYGPVASDLSVSMPGTATADVLVPGTGDSKSSIIKLSSSYLTKINDGEYAISWNILGNLKDYTSDFLSKATTKTLEKAQIPSSALVKGAQPDLSKLSHDEKMTALPNLFSTATYKDVVKNVDVDVTVTPDKLKECLIIKSPKGFTSISYLINAGDLNGAIAEDNSVIFTNNNDEAIFTIPKPYMFDSKTFPDDSYEIKLSLSKTSGGYILTMTPDAKWMNDPSRVYPVTLDPTITTTQSSTNVKDTYVHSGDAAGNHYLSSYVKIGKTDGATCRGYINFANRPTIDTNLNDITGGNLVGYLASGTSTYYPMTIYQPTSAWNSSTISWANKPGNSAAIATVNGQTGGTYIKYTFPVDASVINWYTTGVNNGYMIKYNNEAINDYNWIYASDHPTLSTAYYPSLVISYIPDSTPPVISNYTLTPNTTSASYTTNDNPVITWAITENHFQKVEYAIGTGAYTTIGTSNTGSYTIPDGIITGSGTDTIKLRALDLSGNHSTVATVNYYFDVNAPTKTETPPDGETQVKFTQNGGNIIVDVWVSDVHSGLLNYKVGATGTLTAIPTNQHKISYTVPATDPIRTLYVYDKVGNVYNETFNPGDIFAPNAPSVIQTGYDVEIVDNGDVTDGTGSYRDADGNLCLSDKMYYQVNGGAYTECDPLDEELYISQDRYRIDLDRNIDNTVVVKAEDTFGNVCAETTYTLPKEIGNYEETVTDINYDQLAEPLSITRTYNSNTNKWFFSFDTKIESGVTDRILTLTLQSGEKEFFIFDEEEDKYIGTDSGTEMTISGGYYCLDIGDYYFKYRVSDGKIFAIYLSALSISPIAQYSYDSSGTHIEIGGHTININVAKTAVEVKKGTETLETVSYVFISNQLTSTTDPMGKISEYRYLDEKLRQISLGDGSNSYLMDTISYTTGGQVDELLYRNGSAIEYEYSTSEEEGREGWTKVVEHRTADDKYSTYYISKDLSIEGDDDITQTDESFHFVNANETDPGSLVYTYADYIDSYGESQQRIGCERRTLVSQTGTMLYSYTYYEYDENGNTVVTASLVSNISNLSTTYDSQNQSIYDEVVLVTYNGEGQITEEVHKKKVDGTLIQISQADYTYDAWGRNGTRTETTQSGVVTLTEYTYNGFGLVTQEETTVDSEATKVTTYVYDQSGQLLRQNQDGKITRILYDSFGRTSKEIAPKYFAIGNDSLTFNSENMAYSSGTYSGTDNTTRYTYNNAIWKLGEMTDQYGITTEYIYDVVGNLTKQEFDLYTVDQNASGGITNVKVGTQNIVGYTYDSSGKLSTKAFGNGQNINYTYSGDNIETISYGTTLAFEFTYAEGVMTSKKDYLNNTTTEYSGREVKVYDSSDNLIYSYTNESGYESNGSAVKTLTEKSGTASYITKNYDTYDVFGIKDGTTSLYKSYTKTDGRIDSTSVKLNSLSGTNLLTTNFTYTGDKVTQVANAIGSASKNFSYEYDSEDRISKVSCVSGDVDYFYDGRDQLIRANDEILGKTFIYTYNSRGNLTSKATYDYTTADPITETPTSTDSYSYGDSNWPDKLTSYNGQVITYDANGNPISYKGYAMTWTAGRMLDSMIGNNKTLYFKYDDEGIRTQKTADGTVTQYTTIDGRITSQKDDTNTLYFHYDQNNELAGVMINGTEYLYVRNLQGDIVSMVDTSGNVVVNYTYDAWGKVQNITGSLASTIGAINPMGYRGYYQDVETGLYYLQSRYYDPDTCRMISGDDIGALKNYINNNCFDDNLYIYCNNSPIMYSDPSGNIVVPTITFFMNLKEGINSTAAALGFAYDSNQKIWYSLRECWQKKWGYCQLYNDLAPFMGCFIIDNPLSFNYDDKEWRIWLWKGQYGPFTGGEMGVYIYSKTYAITHNGFRPKQRWYRSAEESEFLRMQFSLFWGTTELFSREAYTWWLTGFKAGIAPLWFNLTMYGSVTFKNLEMAEAFCSQRGISFPESNRIYFVWGRDPEMEYSPYL